jgi:predicted nuclease with TOPRIM domain
MPFTVEEFQDLVRLLEQRPEWRAELRRLVLTDELLALPEQLASFRAQTEQRFEELVEAQRRTDERLAALAEAQRRTDERLAELAAEMAELTRKVATLVDQSADLRGKDLEAQYRVKAHAYFGRLLRRIHVLSPDDLAGLVDGAVEAGILSDDQAHEIFLADAVVRGRRREDGAEVHLVVEVSWGVGPDDVERAVKRAELLAKTGLSTLPVVAGKTVTAEAARLARTWKVWQVTDGQVGPPQRPSELS